jgi:hypothetical protein
MAKKRYVTERRYTIHWYCNGFCYKTTRDCPKDYVDNCKATARLLGEKVKVELERIVKYEY